jgi:hypothetical protein
LDKADIGSFTDNNNVASGPNNRAGTYSESATDAALRFGICFTTKQFHKTKTLKVLSSEASASHYLYKEIIEWGCAAQHGNYDFNHYLENWLQLQNS